MPGIVGIIGWQLAPEESAARVARMTRALVHEPFHQSGTTAFPELNIQAGWVAHAGSLAANQVFWNESRKVALLFAGECFITPEFRARLLQSGHAVGSEAGAWLVHAYEELGEKFFAELNGLFSGLLVDLRRSRAWLFNDRYGIERLYWHESSGAIYFASEAKALLEVVPEVRAFDTRGVAQHLQYGCTLGEQTLFKGIRLAPGASLWSITPTAHKWGRYFTPDQWESQPALSPADFEAVFQPAFDRVAPRYLDQAPQVGVSLTGGLDTRMILAALGPERAKLASYTFGGAGRETLDVIIARRVADACGLSHQVLPLREDFFRRFAEYADRTVYCTDGCFGALGAHEIYFHEQVRAVAPVRLTGNYGSEILRSMSTFKPLGLAPELSPLNQSMELEWVSASHPVTFAAFEEVPWNLFGTLAAGRSQVTFRTPYLDNELVALAFRAPHSARTSSASATRYLSAKDPTLAAIPTDRGVGGTGGLVQLARRTFAEVMCKLDYHYSEGLPRRLAALDGPYAAVVRALGISGSHKLLQYRRWLQVELSGFVQERLAAVELPFWNSGFVRTMPAQHVAGLHNFSREINAVITLETVNRTMLKRASSR